VDAAFLVEQYLPSVDASRLDELVRRLDAQRPAVSLLGAAGLPEDETLLALVAARDPGSLARALTGAGVAPDRIVPALWLPGPAR
jgi:hypothetical protein